MPSGTGTLDVVVKDVIVIGIENENLRFEGEIDRVKNYTSILKRLEFRTIQREVNGLAPAIKSRRLNHG